MLTTFANSFAPIFANYVYIGGGFFTLVLIILVVLFLVRRRGVGRAAGNHLTRGTVSLSLGDKHHAG
jgi:hypothetical protein